MEDDDLSCFRKLANSAKRLSHCSQAKRFVALLCTGMCLLICDTSLPHTGQAFFGRRLVISIVLEHRLRPGITIILYFIKDGCFFGGTDGALPSAARLITLPVLPSEMASDELEEVKLELDDAAAIAWYGAAAISTSGKYISICRLPDDDRELFDRSTRCGRFTISSTSSCVRCVSGSERSLKL
uniref:Uncharacterized protein n=1 Tax=Anopheles coluzzii TaxID=1518534 RepID=A0A8W7PUC1_ANOCL